MRPEDPRTEAWDRPEQVSGIPSPTPTSVTVLVLVSASVSAPACDTGAREQHQLVSRVSLSSSVTSIDGD